MSNIKEQDPDPSNHNSKGFQCFKVCNCSVVVCTGKNPQALRNLGNLFLLHRLIFFCPYIHSPVFNDLRHEIIEAVTSFFY